MKKTFLLLLILFLTMPILGCTPQETAPPNQPSLETPGGPAQQAEDQPAETPPAQQAGNPAAFQAHLGGIALGDSKEKVIQTLGSAYQEQAAEADLTLNGEPFAIMTYANGTVVVVSAKSNRVMEIETTSPATSTNLGFKVGDKAADVLAAYRAKYQEPVSRHDDSKLTGWFLLNEDEALVIFNFDQTDSLVNPDLKPDARVSRIKLSNFKYMD